MPALVFTYVMEFLTDTQLGERFKALRETAGISPEDAAHALGTETEEITRIESGDVRPVAHETAALSDLYGMPISAFLLDEGAAPIMFRDGHSSREGFANSLMVIEDCMEQFFAAESLELATR